MRRMRELWPRKKPPRTVDVGSHESKFSGLRPMHVDADDDGRTREDVDHQKAESRPPHGGGFSPLGQ
jgi:hypothetical protein